MGFLDNSGDIILDAVLTDTGRMRLARGDGSFKIAKFAFGDDEINYGSFNADHASGSAYYDLEILQTPVLEAFTNNTATMKSKLISLTNNNLLYLPVMIINDNASSAAPHQGTMGSGSFLVMVDADTVAKQKTSSANFPEIGTLDGVVTTSNGGTPVYIRVDQGLHTTEVSAVNQLDQGLREDQFIVEMDHRLGKLHSKTGAEQTFSFVDDDQIASYFVSGAPLVKLLDPGVIGSPETLLPNEIILGPRGNSLEFKIKSSTNLESSTYLFEQIGGTVSILNGSDTETYYYIDATVRAIGATTGYRIDIPVRYIKYKETTTP